MPKTYTPIATRTLSTATATITFSSIPSTYTDLVLVINAGGSVAGNGVRMRFNSDTGTNYSETALWGTGSSAASGRHSNDTAANLSVAIGLTTNPSDVVMTVNIQNYSNTTTYKPVISRANNGSSTASYPGSEAVAAIWRSTSAINTIAIINGADFIPGSTFTLYGILKA